MATKTISITEEAYEMLRSWKLKNESFSNVIIKIGRKNRLSSYAGILSAPQAKSLKEAISSGRALSRKRARFL